MKLSPKAKKWGKRLLILLLIRLVVGGILYYVIVYRFKEIVQVVVKKETDGAYAFDASDAKLSLFRKKLVLRNVTLVCKDSMSAAAHYAVNIPEVYLAIDSWMDLIFHKKVAIDSLVIVQPQVIAHQHQRHEKKQVSFHAAEIFSGLQKALKHLQVRSFSLQNGAYTYGTVFNDTQFKSNQINFSVRNFAQQHTDKERLLSSDDVTLELHNQHWTLPSGSAEISFKRLYFSGATETFRLDSCAYRSLDSTKPRIAFSADKLYFNSKQLADIYEKEELVIDTLFVERPVVKLQTGNQRTLKDSAHIGQAFEKMFAGIKFKYLDVKEGQLSFYKTDERLPTYVTEKTDLKIFNLQMEPRAAHISTDSIQLSLHNLRMVTRDSLFEMKVQDFAFRNNELVFKNVSYGPTAFNQNEEGISFETPLLELKDVDLESLLHKRLQGTEAILHRPSITVYKKGKTVKSHRHKGNDDHFYQTLHGVGELIDVNDFRIVDGSLSYKAHGGSDIKMDMKGLNAGILLNQFLASDSLIDIKRAMPDLRIREMLLASPKLKLSVNDYHFDGSVRHNAAKRFHLSLVNGTDIAGTDLYWNIFDWDMFKNHGIIQVESIDAHELKITPVKPDHVQQERKELPVIAIRRVDVGSLDFNQAGSISFNAKNICVDNMGSEKHFLHWKNAAAELKDIVITRPHMNAAIGRIDFTNEYESVLHNAVVVIDNEKSTVNLALPVVKLKAALHSTDMARLNLAALVLDDPNITIKNSGEKKNPGALKMPVELNAGKMVINRGKLNYTSGSDVSVNGVLNFNAYNIKTNKEKDPVQFDSVIVVMNDLSVVKKDMEIGIGKTNWVLSEGAVVNTEKGLELKSDIVGKWSDVSATVHAKDSLQVTVEKLKGGFAKYKISLIPAPPLTWKTLMYYIHIDDAAVHMRTQSMNASLGSVNWEKYKKQLTIRSFSMQPNAGMEETFAKANKQTDYIAVEGKTLFVNGLQFDSSLDIQSVLAVDLSLTAARDKRKPFAGTHKLMPTQLLQTIKLPFSVNIIMLQDSKITVYEISAATHKTGSIPFEDVDAAIMRVTNRPGPADSLQLMLSAHLLNNHIREFYYSEAYNDSLSHFRAGVRAASMPLPPYSNITVPLAAVNVAGGNADTLFANWTGNTHGAIGTMNFHYSGLKVKLLDKHDPSKKHFWLALENWLANSLVIKNNNREQSRIFFMRDKQKFIFNYWAKTLMHGMMSSVGVKSNRKYLKQYRKAQQTYELPEE